jgi:hypothetical protein
MIIMFFYIKNATNFKFLLQKNNVFDIVTCKIEMCAKKLNHILQLYFKTYNFYVARGHFCYLAFIIQKIRFGQFKRETDFVSTVTNRC